MLGGSDPKNFWVQDPTSAGKHRKSYHKPANVFGVENLNSELRIRIRNPGSSAFLTPGSGMDKKSKSRSGINIPDHNPGA
jgi:hypothetical protein